MSDVSLDEIEQLVEDRVQEATADLQKELQHERDRRRELEEEIETLREENDSLEERVEELETRQDVASTARESIRDEIYDTDAAVGELQSREMEKGAHLRADTVDPAHLEVDGDRVEYFTGDDGTEYVRCPGESDPLERSGTSVLATADLLPIQQLARMDDEMLASATSKRADYLAAKAWNERGRDSPASLWNAGSGKVREYLDASDVRIWIKANHERPDETLSDEYAKDLARETLDRIVELAKNRVYTKIRSHRKDGLRYKETRLIVPRDTEIPGETTAPKDGSPGTNAVTGG